MFRVAGAAAESATDTDAGICLEALRPVRVDQLKRALTFPGDSILTRVCIDAGGAVKKVIQVHDDREARDGLHVVLDRTGIERAVNNLGIHSVIDGICSPARRPSRRRSAGWRLTNHVVEEEVGLCIDV